MHRLVSIAALALLAALGGCSAHENSFGFEELVVDHGRLPARIAFGSCADQKRPQPILRQVIARDPELFVYLGDNIYGDTEDMEVLRANYLMLEAKPEFQALRRHCPTLAIWDDHDYGANDAGKEYPEKEASREIFLDFWRVPGDSARRDHPGIYHEHRFSDGERTLQVILLDTRSFRDPLVTNAKPPVPPNKNDYRPNPDAGATILGGEQWRWLEGRLRSPADLRIIATSIQFGHEYNGWESWTNVPHERQRFIDLIGSTRAEGVIFISGDVHWGEISRQDVPRGYPLHDVTASGLNKDWDSIEPNRRRVGPPVRQYNFGLISIDWGRDDPVIRMASIDVNGDERNRVEVPLSALGWGARAGTH